jgi:hypothetical protein
LLDIAPTSLTWNTTQGGVDFSYKVSGADLPNDTTAMLYWASGKTEDTIIDIASNPIPITGHAVGDHGPIHVSAADFTQPPPAGAKYLLLKLDPDNKIDESDEKNNVLAITGPQNHCQPGEVFTNVGLPAVSLPIAVAKSTGLELAFDPFALNFTVQTPGPGIECIAQSNVGTLIASIRSTSTSETHAVGFSTATATLTLNNVGNLHWHTDGFEVRAGSAFGLPLPIPLGTWGPYDFDVNVATLGLTTNSDFETIVRSAEPYIHVQLSQQLFTPFTQVLVMEDPGKTDLLVTSPLGMRVGKINTGEILQEIPGSAYFASVPLVALVAPSGGVYQTQVRGTGSGSYTLVTALIDGQSIRASQTFTGSITAGLTAVYSTTLDPSAGKAQTRVELGQSLSDKGRQPALRY